MATLSGLTADTGYRWRVVSTNGSGTTTVEGAQFPTLVSPTSPQPTSEFSYGDAITAVIDEAGFDSSRSNSTRKVVGRWVNAAHREMIRKARFLGERRELGPTVAGKDSYALDPDIVEVQDIMVGGTSYTRKGRRQLRGIQSYVDRILVPGTYTPTYDADRVRQITLYPAPQSDGVSMLADVFVIPPDMVDEDQDFLEVGGDFAEAIIDKAAAYGRARVFNDPSLASWANQNFADKTEELRRLVNQRVNSGPVQLRVVG
jgi:hypothetical protein